MTDNYFNTDIIRNHDEIMLLNGWMVEHFNFVLTLPWMSDDEIDSYEDEMASYLCYDV